MILENMVFKYMDNKGEIIRIIYIDEQKDVFSYVSMDIDLCTPKWEKLSKIQEEIENNVLVKLVDPYLKNIDERKLSPLEKEKRDTNWNLINEAWENRKLELLDKKTKNKVFEDISVNASIPVITLKRMFSRFWQRGMTKNALLTDYKNSGAKGKQRKLLDSKVGRPKKADYNGNEIIGINITEDIKKLFQIAINKYYRNSNKISLKETYNYILKDFFSNQFMENGERKFIVWDKSRIPTYDQFYYWFKIFEDPKKDIILRESAKEFELKNRPILSNSTIETDDRNSVSS